MVWNGGRREIFRVQRPREFRCQCVHRQLIQDGDKRAEAACERAAREKNTAHTHAQGDERLTLKFAHSGVHLCSKFGSLHPAGHTQVTRYETRKKPAQGSWLTDRINI